MTRELFLRLHRYAGLFMAFFLIVAGATGAVIAYYDELEPALNPDLYYVEPQQSHLALDVLLTHLEDSTLQGQARVRFVHFPVNQQDSIRFIVLPKQDLETEEDYPLDYDWVFANPYTGEVLGTRMFGAWRFDRAHIIPWLYKMHYSLTIPWPWGYWIFGAAAVIWVLDCFWSFFLTLPRARRNTFKKWRKAWTIKFTAGNARLIRDLHIAVSLWLWAMLLILALSSVKLNLDHEVFQPLLSKFVQYEHARDTIAQPSAEQREQTLSFGEIKNIAQSQLRIWQKDQGFDLYHLDSIAMDFAKHAYRVRVKTSLDLPNSYAQTALYLSAFDGRVLAKSYPYKDTGNAIATWLSALHMGRLFGFWYKVFISVMGLVVVLATITGVLIWWRKRRVGRPASLGSKRKNITM